MKKNILSIIAILCTHILLTAQTTIAFQGGEGTAADNWGFTAPFNAGGSALLQPGIVATLPRTGTKSIRAAGGNNTSCSGGANCITGNNPGATGCSMHGNTISFNSINTSCLSGVVLTCYHRSHTACSGSGFDTGESLFFEVSLNGGAFTTVGTLTGSGGEYTWAYTTTPAGQSSTVTNPFTYNVPAGTNTFAFRVRATINRADEVFYLDDVKLTTTTTGYTFPGTAGLWGGYVDDNWFNACNWSDRTVPTSATNVTFPSNNTGNNNIVIQPATNPICNNLTINGAGARQIKGEGAVTKKLTIMGNLSIGSTDGLDFSDGTTGTPDGTIELYGNWTNLGVESDFKEGNSTVKLLGTANQSINTADIEEAFYILEINKGSGLVTMNDDVWIDKDFEGGTNPLLIFTQGNLDLNNHILKIWNSNEQAVTRTSGGAISEKTSNASKVTWFIDNNTGAHIFPFVRTDNFYIPFTFNLTAGDVNDLTMSTYPTPNNNTPYPVTPQTVTNLYGAAGADNSANTINRFWQIDKTGASGTANLTFTYGDNEWDSFELPNYEAQRWSPSSWQAAPGSQTQNSATNSVFVPGITTFSPWTLASKLLPLPVELIDFSAIYNEKQVDLNWTTATENDNHYFTVERSGDGQNFEPILHKNSAGNSRNINYYQEKDLYPLPGISYYRLKQTDFNQNFKHSKIVSVETYNENSATLYPNPTEDGKLHVSVVSQKNVDDLVTVEIFNAIGKLVSVNNYKQSNVNLNFSEFGKGIYFVRVSLGSEIILSQRVLFN